MTTELATTNGQAVDPSIVQSLVLNADLGGMSKAQQVDYYVGLCKRLNLDPYTRPFILVNLQGKLVMYATRAATQQLARNFNISTAITGREWMKDEGLYVVTVRATLPNGTATENIGAVNIKGLGGDNLSNAMMKAVTKAQRRAVLSLVGLGMMGEDEAEDVPTTKAEQIDLDAVEVKPDDVVETWRTAIEACSSDVEMARVRAELGKLPDDVKTQLAPVFNAQMQALGLVIVNGKIGRKP